MSIMSMETTRVAQDAVLTVGEHSGSSSGNHNETPPELKYVGDPPDGGVKAWSVVLG